MTPWPRTFQERALDNRLAPTWVRRLVCLLFAAYVGVFAVFCVVMVVRYFENRKPVAHTEQSDLLYPTEVLYYSTPSVNVGNAAPLTKWCIIGKWCSIGKALEPEENKGGTEATPSKRRSAHPRGIPRGGQLPTGSDAHWHW